MDRLLCSGMRGHNPSKAEGMRLLSCVRPGRLQMRGGQPGIRALMAGVLFFAITDVDGARRDGRGGKTYAG